MKMNHFGIFLEPNSELLRFILDLKKSLLIYNKNLPYLLHPPHLTLVHGLFSDKFTLEKKLEEFLLDKKPFDIFCTNLCSFKDDSQTGLNTVYVSLEPNNYLNNFQKDLLKNINPTKSVFKPSTISSEELKKNLKLYNYPFVYPNWIPHFTIASVDKVLEEKILQFNNQTLELCNKISKVSIWEISGDLHKKIKEFEISL